MEEDKSVYGLTSPLIIPLESAMRVTLESAWRERRMRVLHKAMKVVVVFLRECEIGASIVNTR